MTISNLAQEMKSLAMFKNESEIANFLKVVRSFMFNIRNKLNVLCGGTCHSQPSEINI